MKITIASLVSSLLLASAFLHPSVALAQSTGGCPDLEGGYGPFDYTDPYHRTKHLPVVEQYHFTPRVRNLIRGQSGSLGGDLDYTIRAFPNHHQALDALSRLSIKLKTSRPHGIHCTVDGFFERAVRFKPDDARLHMAYGMHLYRLKKFDAAMTKFEEADKLAPDDANIAYNLGLIYADLKKWDKAKGYAEKAYAAGFPLPGLKNRLIKAGKWTGTKRTNAKAAAAKNEDLKEEALESQSREPSGSQSNESMQ